MPAFEVGEDVDNLSEGVSKLFLQKEIKAIEKRFEEASVVIQHLEMHIINAACDDPGTALGSQLLLPLLQVSSLLAAAAAAAVG
eukprot:scaffold44939_cov18-Tisochrysis_lutea.AAC.1